MRRISPGTVTIGVMAILFGLVAAYVIRQSMDRKEVTVLPPPPPTPQGKRVVVATVNMVKNSMVGNKQVRVTYVPEDRELPENIFRYAPPVIGRYLKQTVKAGQAITDDMLMPIGEGLPGLDEEVPEGYRAMPLSVAGTYLRKLIKVGSNVDVTLTVEGEHPDLGQVMTETLLQNLRVIDVDDPVVDPKRGQISEKLNVTLAATPRDCNVLITAQQRGTLGLTLVGPHEAGERDERDQVRFTDIVKLSDPPPPPAQPDPPAEPEKYIVETWSGGVRRTIELPTRTVEESRRASATKTISTDGEKPHTNDAAVISGAGNSTLITTGQK